jgi:FkbM family methyltransferase
MYKLIRKAGEQLLWKLDNRRGAVATIKWLGDNNIDIKCLVDAGANNSQWMYRLANHFPNAKVLSFEPQSQCRPLGKHFVCALSDAEGNCNIEGTGTSAVVSGSKSGNVRQARLDEFENEIIWPAFLKVDCEDHTYKTLIGAGRLLPRFSAVVVEIWEYLGLGRNYHAEIHSFMWSKGFNRAMTVGTMPFRNHVSHTDVLFWKEL